MRYTLNTGKGRQGLPMLFDDFLTRDLLDTIASPKRNTGPATNIRESDEAYQLDVLAAGWNNEDFKLAIEDNTLTISAEVATQSEESKERYTRREFTQASFSRGFDLPEGKIVEEEIKATYNNGVLSITLPKRAELPAEESKRLISIN